MPKNKAKILYNSNFRIFGIGHFDVKESEAREIFKILEERNAKVKLSSFYKKLYHERMD